MNKKLFSLLKKFLKQSTSNIHNRIFIAIAIAFITINYSFAEIINDELVEETLKNKVFDKIETNTQYNYESVNAIPIALKIQENITTKKNLQEGDILIFTVKNNVKYDNQIIIKKGTIVTARVKTYISRGFIGIPGQIIVDDFVIPGIDSKKLKSTYIARGLDLTIMILPIKWILTPIPFAGSFTNLILGGHGKITKDDNIILYYYPDWGI